MASLAEDFRKWHQTHFPEWYEAMPTLPIFDSDGRHVGYKFIKDPTLNSRDAEFEMLMTRLAAITSGWKE